MATFSKLHLSGSTGGQPIKISATTSAGTIVHTTGTSSSTIDEVWIYAHNTSVADTVLTIEYGGTTNPDNRIVLSVPAQAGLTLVLPGLILSGDDSSGRSVRAFAATTNVITISGYVNRVA
jgi:hypothetical protein